MSGYIGTTPVPQATQHREAFTANANQTTFATAGYTVGYIDVWVNGVKLAAADVTVTNGSDIVLASAAAANDIVEYLAFVPFEAVNQTFTGATVVNSLNLNGDGATVTGIKDEDNMASNDANKLATQQSIKAYVDAQVTAQDLDFQGDSGGALSIDLDSETLDIAGGTNITTAGSGNTVTVNIAPLDEDNMASNSATQVASQQSIKAYVDTTVGATNEVVEDTTPQLGGDLASNGNDILMADNDKARFGADSDLQIYHDGSNSYVNDNGTGDLVLKTAGAGVQMWGGGDVMLNAVKDGAVTLYHDNAAKLATTSSGIDVTGNIIGSDELQLKQPNGTNNFGMELNNSHQVKYKARGSSGTHIFTNTTSDTERLRIDSSGIDVTGTVTATTLQTTAGGTVTTASGNDLNIVYPDTRSLFFKEGSTTTLSLDNAQNATFAGTVTATGVTVGNSSIGSNTSHLANLTINNNSYIGSVNATSAIQIATSGAVTFGGSVTASGAIHAQNDSTIFKATNSGNPALTIGSSATNGLMVQSIFHSGAQTLNQVVLRTFSSHGGANAGKMIFGVDEIDKLEINDSGIDVTGTVTSGAITASGNVTIDGGTSSSLIIDKDGTGSGKISFHNAGSQISYIALDAAEDMYYYGASGVDQIFYAHGAEVLRLASGNSTFAGTVTSGAITSSGNLIVNTAGNSLPSISLSHSNVNADNFIITGGVPGTSNAGFSIRDVDASANRLVIDSTGKVGIGVADPVTKLEVQDDSTWNVATISSNYPVGAGLTFDAQYGGSDWSIISQGSSGGAGAGNLSFHLTTALGGNSAGYKMTLTDDGNLGIGVSSLQANSVLEVNGRARFATGSEALPALSSFSDLDTGIFFPGSNVLSMSTAGTERMRIDSNGHVLPGANSLYDLGSSSLRWANIFTGDLHLSNEGSEGNEVDGTTGNWTIQEGDEHLFIKNNKTGKKYKFALEEIV